MSTKEKKLSLKKTTPSLTKSRDNNNNNNNNNNDSSGMVWKIMKILAILIGLSSSFTCAYFVSLSTFHLGKGSSPSTTTKSTSSPSSSSTHSISDESIDKLPQLLPHDLNNMNYWQVNHTRSTASYAMSHVPPLVSSAPLVNDWGSFRPSTYFGLRNKAVDSPHMTGIIWSSSSNRENARHLTRQDELSRLQWIRHDGMNFGHEELIDEKLNLRLDAQFVIPQSFFLLNKNGSDEVKEKRHLQWLQKFSFSTVSSGSSGSSNQQQQQPSPASTTTTSTTGLNELSFLFYFGVDCDFEDVKQRQDCFRQHQMSDISILESSSKDSLVVSGYSSSLGRFALVVLLHGRKEEEEEEEEGHDSHLSYLGIEGVLPQDLPQRLVLENTLNRRGGNNPRTTTTASVSSSMMIDGFGDLSNSVNTVNDQLVLQLRGLQGIEMTIALYDHLSVEFELSSTTTSLTDYDKLWNTIYTYYLNQFEEKFHTVYLSHTDDDSFSEVNYSSEYNEIAKVCLSSLLGGIGYFVGTPSIGHGIDVSTTTNATTDLSHSSSEVRDDPTVLRLFTATPSRTVFPRGFLWDEGFHQMVINQWDSRITLQVLQHWMNTLHFFHDDVMDPNLPLIGWLPREMILGQEGRNRVPEEFLHQRVNIANPPTFFLVIDQLIDQLIAKETCSEGEEGDNRQQATVCDEVLQQWHSLQDLYPRLEAWLNWFWITQHGEDEGSFRWRGRSLNDNKNLPNTLASGLDDYPRSLYPIPNEKHVDLHCWILRATKIINRLYSALDQVGLPPPMTKMNHPSKWMDKVTLLEKTLYQYHWSEEYHGFYDTGLNNESAVFVSEVLFRCGNPESRMAIDGYIPVQILQAKQSFCPPTYPQAVGPISDGNGGYRMRERLYADNFTLTFLPRQGYVTLFPLLLHLLPVDSVHLAHTLDVMEDLTLLWTDFGLRSMATTDKFYNRRNAPGDAPYWRAPIWVNINYLALGALHHYGQLAGPYQTRIRSLYNKLRKGLIENVFKEFRRTGQFWEQYDDNTGSGMRGHPFTGWTSTIINILYELY